MFYQAFFQQPGTAEAELERDVRSTMRRWLYGLSGDAPSAERWHPILPDPQAGPLNSAGNPTSLPSWVTEADLDVYTAEFARTGFRGGLNWYRNIDRNWELLAPFAGVPVTVPALYIAGDRDPVMRFPGMDQLLPNLTKFVPRLDKTIILPGCGHWTQQERPAEVNSAMIDFLKRL